MIDILILAAGKGTRMKTEKPKALVEAAGKPLLGHVLDTVKEFGARPYVVLGYRGEEIANFFGDRIKPVWQKEQKGTGHAVLSAREPLSKSGSEHVIVLSADQPLVSAESIKKLIDARERTGAAIAMATVAPEHHDGDYVGFRHMGRIIRGADGHVEAIVEYKNASDVVRALKEVNITTYCFDPKWLWANLDMIVKNEVSGEYYITDLVSIARASGLAVAPVVLPAWEGVSANTIEELAAVERLLESGIY